MGRYPHTHTPARPHTHADKVWSATSIFSLLVFPFGPQHRQATWPENAYAAKTQKINIFISNCENSNRNENIFRFLLFSFKFSCLRFAPFAYPILISHLLM